MKPAPIHITVDPIQFESSHAELEAYKLTGANIQMLKNLISTCLNDLIALNVDPANETDYLCKVARIKGEIGAYTHLINSHNEAHSI